MRDRFNLIHFFPEGDGGSGDGGTGETPEAIAAREAQEATARAQAERDAADKNKLVPISEVQEANREAQTLRARAKAAEDELKAIKDAQLSDTDKAKKDAEDARAEAATAKQRVRNLQVQVLASKVGIVDPAAAAQLLDWSKIADPDDDKSVEKALRDLVKEKTYLVPAGGGSDGGAGNGSGGGTEDMNQMIRQAAGRG